MDYIRFYVPDCQFEKRIGISLNYLDPSNSLENVSSVDFSAPVVYAMV